MRNLFILLSAISLSVCEEISLEEFANANNAFAQDVYKEVVKSHKDNFLVSPFSAETVLAFLQSGSHGKTGEEIRTALHLPNDKIRVEDTIKNLLPKFKSSNDLYSLHTANKIYVKKNLQIKNDFRNISTVVYQSETESLDFSKSVEAANTVNQWVEQQTNNKIKNLITSDDLNDGVAALLINALYFKANWSNPFEATRTAKTQFFITEKDVVSVDTLHHVEKEFNYYESASLKAQFLKLPFQGEEASLVIVLPNEKNGLPALENQLDQVFSQQHKLESTLVNVALPKFRIETLIDLKAVLQNLGVNTVFDGSKADLSGIAGEPGELAASKAAQKTFIEVSEEGVEAAAATYVLVNLTSALDGDPQVPKNFIADHPFIFYIRLNGAILFAGRVTDPSSV